ncbi:MAG: alcohol dehydrogenase catalytic domain-containing protein [Arcanobacterium sp.]|nr:alcohol dehydrogenase catalytic domain-containing protein [Arcanobacterium sp.]
MITATYQVTAPRTVAVKFSEISAKDRVWVRPTYMSICHADQRYYQGLRPKGILDKKFPMALIHEAVGVVVRDDSGEFDYGTPVVMIPNIPGPPIEGVFENYAEGFTFLSSGADGFMREIVDVPARQLVPLPEASALTSQTEMTSVACHAIHRWEMLADDRRRRVGIWGDGSLGYIVASVLRELHPDLEIYVVGTHREKLDYFTVANQRFVAGDLPKGFCVDHAFECAGGEGSGYAIAEAVDRIVPQGSLVLMGVSENVVGIATRMVLEKGLTLIGSSRSGREDFERAAKLWESQRFCVRMKRIIYEEDPVQDVHGIHRVFMKDLGNTFKTVFHWGI